MIYFKDKQWNLSHICCCSIEVENAICGYDQYLKTVVLEHVKLLINNKTTLNIKLGLGCIETTIFDYSMNSGVFSIIIKQNNIPLYEIKE